MDPRYWRRIVSASITLDRVFITDSTAVIDARPEPPRLVVTISLQREEKESSVDSHPISSLHELYCGPDDRLTIVCQRKWWNRASSIVSRRRGKFLIASVWDALQNHQHDRPARPHWFGPKKDGGGPLIGGHWVFSIHFAIWLWDTNRCRQDVVYFAFDESAMSHFVSSRYAENTRI